MAKTSDLEGGKEPVRRQPKFLRLSRVAAELGFSERTIRDWCKQRLIQEAYQTPGGHWRIRMPLSGKTRILLNSRSGEWPFKKNAEDFEGDWDHDFAEWLLLAQLYECALDERVPVPYLAEQWDSIAQDLTEEAEQADPERASKARRIQDEIIRRLQAGKSFSDLLLIGWVYQFWLKNQRGPTVGEIADFMGLSRQAFYRRYTRADLYRALRVARGHVKARLPDPGGLDSVQKANLKAKKRTIDHDPFADD
jgi:hypothetical protein